MDCIILIRDILVLLRDHQNNNVKIPFENVNKVHWYKSIQPDMTKVHTMV